MFKVGQLVTVNIPQGFVHNAEEFFIDGFTGGTFNLPIIAVDSSTLEYAGYTTYYNPEYPIVVQLPDTVSIRDSAGRLSILSFTEDGNYYEEWDETHPWLSRTIPLQRRKPL